MQKLKTLFENLLAELNIPNLKVEKIGNTKQDGYEISYKGGFILLSAENYASGIKALNVIYIGLKSGHISTFLGKTTAKTLLRPLIIQDDLLKKLYDQKHLEVFIKNFLLLGFNAVIIEETNEDEFYTTCETLNTYHIKIILKPNSKTVFNIPKSPLNKNFKKDLSDYFSTLNEKNLKYDYLFWESQLQRLDYASEKEFKDLLLSDVIVKEALTLEKIKPKSKGLFFYIPSEDKLSANNVAFWIEKLQNELSIHTIIAFSAVSGHYLKDHLSPHPFWALERKKIIKSSSKIMSVVNMGSINYGSGLWLNVCTDLIDHYYSSPSSIGIISTIATISPLNGINSLNLFMAGEKLWSNITVQNLLESWLCAYKPDWQYSKIFSVLNQIRSITKSTESLKDAIQGPEKDYLSNHECRQICESLCSQLNELYIYLDKDEQKKFKRATAPSFLDYYSFFSSDIKKIILYISQQHNVSLPNLFNEHDQKDSFWVSIDTPVSQGMRSAVKVNFLKEPSLGSNKKLDLIYQENFFTPTIKI